MEYQRETKIDRDESVVVQKIEPAVASEIKKGSVVVSPGYNHLRLIFDNTAHRTDLNLAVSENPAEVSSFFQKRNWTPLKVTVAGSEKTIYVNVNSLIERFDLSKQEVAQAIDDHTLEYIINKRLLKKLKEIESEGITFNQTVKPPKQYLNHTSEWIKGSFVDALWHIALDHPLLLKLSFLLPDEHLHELSQLRALTSYREAYKRVPAYARHIKDNVELIDGEPQLPQSFEDIPTTDKKNYIKKYSKIADFYLDGEIPHAGQLDCSTGTTGNPTLWLRSDEERMVGQKITFIWMGHVYNKERVILINTFALGLWVSGLSVANYSAKSAIVANVGLTPDFIEKTIEIIRMVCTQDPDRHIQINGYPINLHKISTAINKDSILKDLKLKLHAVVGGEVITEKMRDDIINNGFMNVTSIYGASDLDPIVASETKTEEEIRKACLGNASLANELYGGGPPPMIFRYNPLFYYIETNDSSELIFTSCYKERSSPRIRYNLHDIGKVMLAKDVTAILKKYGINIPLKMNLPFLFIFGRQGAIAYGGAKIHYEHLEEAVKGLDDSIALSREMFALYKSNEDSLEFWVEASSQVVYEDLKAKIIDVKKLLFNKIFELNLDLKKVVDTSACPYPKLRLFNVNETPMAVQLKQHPHKKLQHTYVKTEELEKYLSLASSTVT